MKSVIAKSVEDVKEWIKKPHHEGAALNCAGHNVTNPSEVRYLALYGHEFILGRKQVNEILIPSEILQQCFLKPCLDGVHMYEWDATAETNAKQVEVGG